MRTVWKQRLPIAGFKGERSSVTVQLPKGFRILDVQMQNGEPAMWVEVDPGERLTSQEIVVVGTGHEIPPGPRVFLATVQDGSFVWHFYLMGIDG